jgi:hypothetical protein
MGCQTLLSPGDCNCPACNETFTVRGCNSILARAVPVSVWTNSGKTVLLGTTLSDASGLAVINIGGAGTYYYEVGDGVRFNISSATVAMSCGGSIAVTLTAHSGFHCVAGCAWPILDNLNFTDTFFGSGVASWNGTLWVGSLSYSYPGCGKNQIPPCGAVATLGVRFQVPQSGPRWYISGASCPTNTVGSEINLGGTLASTSCYVPGISAFGQTYNWGGQTCSGIPQANMFCCDVSAFPHPNFPSGTTVFTE